MRPCKVVFADGERDGVLHGIFQKSNSDKTAYPVAVVEVEGALKEIRLKYIKFPDDNAFLQKRAEALTDVHTRARQCISSQSEGTWVPIFDKPEKYDLVMALSYKELANIKRVYVDATEPNYLYHYLIKFFGFDEKLDILVYDNPQDYQFVFYQVKR